MTTFNNYHDAHFEANCFFYENFGYTGQVDIESANGQTVEFYSKDDPGMDDTFKCIINDGYSRYCSNGGPVTIIETERELIIMENSLKLPDNLQELVNTHKVTYRGRGMGKEGVLIRVNGKEYTISNEKFNELGGIDKIRFSAPARKG